MISSQDLCESPQRSDGELLIERYKEKNYIPIMNEVIITLFTNFQRDSQGVGQRSIRIGEVYPCLDYMNLCIASELPQS